MQIISLHKFMPPSSCITYILCILCAIKMYPILLNVFLRQKYPQSQSHMPHAYWLLSTSSPASDTVQSRPRLPATATTCSVWGEQRSSVGAIRSRNSVRVVCATVSQTTNVPRSSTEIATCGQSRECATAATFCFCWEGRGAEQMALGVINTEEIMPIATS